MPYRSLLAALLLLSGLSAHADGLADLKAALQKYSTAAPPPLKAQVTLKVQARRGEGSEATLDQGTASLQVEDDAQGLRLQFGADLLARLRAEDAAREQDAKAPTPTSLALQSLGTRDVRALTAAADTLGRLLARATFKQERATSLNGQAARLLSFDLGPGKLREQDAKYVKNSEGSLQVWIAADGTPLEARAQLKLSGRAFLVVSFETSSSDHLVFARQGERLIAVARERLDSGAGAGEKSESQLDYTLQPQR
ncbi:MAG: hypothetical protein JO224_11115 [Pelomonas sp.]|nr:hypothetical protein [Roseateles sp.]